MSPGAPPTVACPPVFAPWTESCVGPLGGECVDAMHCACPDGYTGAGDFAVGSPTCSINIGAIQALYGLLAFVQPFCALTTLVYIRRIRDRRLLSMRSTRVVGLAAIVTMSVMFFALGVLRASSPTTTGIGRHAGATVLFSLGASCFWIYILHFTSFLVTMSLRQSRVMDMGGSEASVYVVFVSRVERALPVLVVLVLMICFLPCVMLGLNDSRAVFIVGVLHYEGLALYAFILGVVVAPRVLRPIRNEIAGAITRAKVMRMDTHQLEEVHFKLKRVAKDTVSQGIFNVVLASPFGCWPFLQSNSSYWLPVAFFMGSVLAIQTLYTEMPVQRKTSTKAGGTGQSNPQLAATVVGSDEQFSSVAGGGDTDLVSTSAQPNA